LNVFEKNSYGFYSKEIYCYVIDTQTTDTPLIMRAGMSSHHSTGMFLSPVLRLLLFLRYVGTVYIFYVYLSTLYPHKPM